MNDYSVSDIKRAIQRGLQREYGFYPEHKRDIAIWETETDAGGDMLVIFRVRGRKYHITLREYINQLEPIANTIKRIMA